MCVCDMNDQKRQIIIISMAVGVAVNHTRNSFDWHYNAKHIENGQYLWTYILIELIDCDRMQ